MTTPVAVIRSLVDRASTGEAISDKEIENALLGAQAQGVEEPDELLAMVLQKLGLAEPEEEPSEHSSPSETSGALEGVTIGSPSIINSLRSKLEGHS